LIHQHICVALSNAGGQPQINSAVSSNDPWALRIKHSRVRTVPSYYAENVDLGLFVLPNSSCLHQRLSGRMLAFTVEFKVMAL